MECVQVEFTSVCWLVEVNVSFYFGATGDSTLIVGLAV